MGDTSDGPVTLDQCLGAQDTYHVPLVLSGDHIPDSEPLRFQAAAFGIRHFVRWSGTSGLKPSLSMATGLQRRLSNKPAPLNFGSPSRAALLTCFKRTMHFRRWYRLPSRLQCASPKPAFGSLLDVGFMSMPKVLGPARTRVTYQRCAPTRCCLRTPILVSWTALAAG